jgi:hypothetical protein
LEDNELGGCRLDPKKSRRELFQQIFARTRNFGWRVVVKSYAAAPLIVAFSPGHGDKTRFRPWPPIATGQEIIWIAPRLKHFKQLHR